MSRNFLIYFFLMFSWFHAKSQFLPEKISLANQDILRYHILLEELNALTTKSGQKVEIPIVYDFTSILRTSQKSDEVAIQVEYNDVLLKGKEDPGDKEFQTKSIDGLNGLTGNMRIADNGKLLAYSRLTEIGEDYEMVASVLENTAKQLFIQVPDKKIGLGATWTDEYSLDSQVGTSIVTSTYKVELKFEKMVDTLRIPCAKIRFRTIGFSTSIKDELMAMMKTKVSNTGNGEMEGFIYLNAKTNATVVVNQRLTFSTLVKIEKPSGAVDEIKSTYSGRILISLRN